MELGNDKKPVFIVAMAHIDFEQLEPKLGAILVLGLNQAGKLTEFSRKETEGAANCLCPFLDNYILAGVSR